jgi:branched-chain amino acid transport system ATP-binding protein
LLDEPSLGLSPKLVQQMLATLVRLSEVVRAGILLVEQNARLALSASKRAYVMRGGRILLDADSATVASEVKALYFGQTASRSALT